MTLLLKGVLGPRGGSTPRAVGTGVDKLSWKISDHYPLWVEFSV